MEAKPTKEPTYLDQLLTILSVINGIWTTTPVPDSSSHVSQSTVKDQKNFGIVLQFRNLVYVTQLGKN